MLCRYTLASGTHLVVQQAPAAQLAALYAVVNVGSCHESHGTRGAAHFVEHMVFRGFNDLQGKRRTASEIESQGGDLNAYTTFDRTVYHITLPVSRWQMGVEALCGMVSRADFKEEEFTSEKKVILEEARRADDDPGVLIGRKVFSTIYQGSELARPIIGTEQDVANLSVEDLTAFYQRHYGPANISFVVVGDIDAGEVQASFARQFMSSKTAESRGPAAAPIQIDPKKFGKKLQVITGPFDLPRLEVAFPTVRITDDTAPALDAAAFLFGQGETSRLVKAWRDTHHLVSSCSASHFSPITFTGVFEVGAVIDLEKLPATLAVLGEELAKFGRAAPILPSEMERVQKAVLLDRTYRAETVDGLARALVAGVGTPWLEHFETVYQNRFLHLTGENIAHIFQQFFQGGETTLLTLLLPEGNKVDEADLLAQFHRGIARGQVKDIPVSSVAAPATSKGDSFSELFLQDGLQVIYRHLPATKITSVVSVSWGGLREETNLPHGFFHALSSQLGRTTASLEYDVLTEALEKNSVSLEGFSGKDTLGLSLTCTNEQLEEFLSIYAQVIRQSTFTGPQWQIFTAEHEETLLAQEDSASYLCLRSLMERLFPGHPYGHPASGTLADLRRITPALLETEWQRRQQKFPWVVSIVGARSPADMAKLWQNALADWQLDKIQAAPLPAAALLNATPARQKKADRQQAHVALAYPSLSWSDPRLAQLEILAAILGGQGGLLFTELRDKRGLAYSVNPIFFTGTLGGAIGAYLGCHPDKIDESLRGAQRLLESLAERGPTQEQLMTAKERLIGEQLAGLQRTSAQALSMSLMQLYGRGYRYFIDLEKRLQSVEPRDIHELCRELFGKAQPAVSIVHP